MILNTTYKNNNYPIILKENALKELQHFLIKDELNIVMIDITVYNYYKNYITTIINYDNVKLMTIKSGEDSKQLPYYQALCEKLLSLNINRNTQLIAIGGGATGDLIGFLASTLLRGIRFIQIPTTLLAHDSAIGGKVGINASTGKNLIGAFHRPQAVIYDLTFLQSLPWKEIRSGYGEIYKHAILNGESMVNELMQEYPSIKELSKLKNIEKYLEMGIKTKLDIVIKDEYEGNVRKYLNLGHTFGHAVEYLTKIAHGEAVMIGILFQKVLNQYVSQYDSVKSIENMKDYLFELGYPLKIILSLNIEEIIEYMKRDKKNSSQNIHMVIQMSEKEFDVLSISEEKIQIAFNQLKALIK